MYVFLSVLNIISFLICGFFIKAEDQDGKYRYHYWVCAITPIAIYSLSYGLRYGWGVDYSLYKDIYEKGASGLGFKEYEYFFTLINTYLLSLGLPFYIPFILYSTTLILGAFFILRRHREIIIYALPFFYILTFQSTNLIRYFFGIGFVLIAIRYWLEDKYMFFFFFYAIGVLIHSSLALFLPFVIVFKYIDIFRNLKFILFLYFVSYLLQPEILGGFIVNYISGIDISEVSRFQVYIDNYDENLSGENLLENSTGYVGSTIFLKLRILIVDIVLLVLGHEIKSYGKYFRFEFFYSLFVIGTLFRRVVMGFELPYRVILFFYMFTFIVGAYVVLFNRKRDLARSVFVHYVIFDFSYIFINNIIHNFNNGYIWD